MHRNKGNLNFCSAMKKEDHDHEDLKKSEEISYLIVHTEQPCLTLA